MKIVLILLITTLLFGQDKSDFKLIKTHPHNKKSYTQGLIFHKGYLYEGTGQIGESALYKIDIKTGKALNTAEIPKHLFGEGVTIFQDKIYQLTWKARIGYVYNLKTMQKEQEFIYPTEGWGLTHNGSELILSDGTNVIYFLDPYTMQEIRRVEVFDNGQPLMNLNELEFIEDEIYANVYTKDIIVRIDPYSGYVNSKIDLSSLYKKRNKEADVLNGIAYDPKTKHLFVTGKYWDKLFEIKLN